MSVAVRTLVLMVLLVGIHFAARWSATAGLPTETRVPTGDLHSLPVQMGDWTGKDVPTDPRIFKATGALAVVNRHFTDATGRTVVAHLALFTDLDAGLYTPHQPEVCIEGSGGRITRSEEIQVEADGGGTFRTRILATESSGRFSRVLFWYQAPATTFTDRYGQREVFWLYRGKPTWPPVVKVMLQMPDPNSQQAKEALTGLARQIHAWVAAYLGPDSDE